MFSARYSQRPFCTGDEDARRPAFEKERTFRRFKEIAERQRRVIAKLSFRAVSNRAIEHATFVDSKRIHVEAFDNITCKPKFNRVVQHAHTFDPKRGPFDAHVNPVNRVFETVAPIRRAVEPA